MSLLALTRARCLFQKHTKVTRRVAVGRNAKVLAVRDQVYIGASTGAFCQRKGLLLLLPSLSAKSTTLTHTGCQNAHSLTVTYPLRFWCEGGSTSAQKNTSGRKTWSSGVANSVCASSSCAWLVSETTAGEALVRTGFLCIMQAPSAPRKRRRNSKQTLGLHRAVVVRADDALDALDDGEQELHVGGDLGVAAQERVERDVGEPRGVEARRKSDS